ncbi:MAG: NifU family protein [Anaerolineales bacterium]|jgi:Fe-S cluster biogenesis protein NfuA
MDIGTNETAYSKTELMTGLLTQISAYIEQYHGGSVELVSFDGETAMVKLGGACVGCPLSAATLKGWVEGTVHQFFPDVKVVGVEE